MPSPTAHPVIYEINTWIWLQELSQKHQRRVTLGTVPAEEWDAIARWRVDAVWLMGVWERSPAGRAIANRNEALLEQFRRTLPDFAPEDNVGSPFSVRRYVADAQLGGADELAAARAALAARGVRLVLDFVPNHVAPDHPWVTEHPEYFIQGSADDARKDPAAYVASGDAFFACGRDPHFPPWPDVLQLNVFQPDLRRAAIETVMELAAQCDGVRCDMAMLVLNDVFKGTWGQRAGRRPPTEYWVGLIAAVKRQHPDFLFIAEAYWDREWDLHQQGFDYCYDKRLYDRLERDQTEEVHRHLRAAVTFQSGLLRFIENHDEPRAVKVFSAPRLRAAAVTMATVPGAKLFQEGQFEGRTVRPPVFLARRPAEPVNADLEAFYRKLLWLTSSHALKKGQWQLCERTGWPDNPSYQHIVAWGWRSDEEYNLIVVNLSKAPAQARVRLPWNELRDATWYMTDLFSGEEYQRSGNELSTEGLFVDLPAWGFHALVKWWGVNA